jgi:hypothetical protein
MSRNELKWNLTEPKVLITWSNHDLVLLGSDSQKGQIILRVNVAHNTPGFGRQLMQQTGILNGRRVVQCGLDWNAFWVDYDETNDTLVGCDSLDSFFNLGLEGDKNNFI